MWGEQNPARQWSNSGLSVLELGAHKKIYLVVQCRNPSGVRITLKLK